MMITCYRYLVYQARHSWCVCPIMAAFTGLVLSVLVMPPAIPEVLET